MYSFLYFHHYLHLCWWEFIVRLPVYGVAAEVGNRPAYRIITFRPQQLSSSLSTPSSSSSIQSQSSSPSLISSLDHHCHHYHWYHCEINEDKSPQNIVWILKGSPKLFDRIFIHSNIRNYALSYMRPTVWCTLIFSRGPCAMCIEWKWRKPNNESFFWATSTVQLI